VPLKDTLSRFLEQALVAVIDEHHRDAGADRPDPPPVQIERARDARHGDFASNIALVSSKALGIKPRDLAQRLVERLPQSSVIERAEIAGPGFINFFVTAAARRQIVTDILNQGEAFGRSAQGHGQSVLIEFVSANPTGPLHVGHGRGAAYGSAVANLLEAVGFAVTREYYVNDAGRQMDILGLSVWWRYLQQQGLDLPFPANGYQGDYIAAIAETLHGSDGDDLLVDRAALADGLPADAPEGGDKEVYVDQAVARARALLGQQRFQGLVEWSLNAILEGIAEDLRDFRVAYDRWYSERQLVDSGAIEAAIGRLEAAGCLYEADGALWFRASLFGDAKDRVVRRENGQTTYFASDIAYHLDKFDRGFTRVIDIWGADHHGYVPRVRGALESLGVGGEDRALDILLVQFAILYRGDERLPMSTRAGEFVTLRELVHEVGADAARFYYVMRRCEQHMDFDLELAKAQTNDNPVYYVQYAHARVCSVMEKLGARGELWDPAVGEAGLPLLETSHEQALIARLEQYPEVLEQAALQHEPHGLTHYLRELATDFHSYYNATPFLVEASDRRNARLNLINAVQQVLRNGLGLLGVSAPERM
jgi:arginyl-tRNA synthetase